MAQKFVINETVLPGAHFFGKHRPIISTIKDRLAFRTKGYGSFLTIVNNHFKTSINPEGKVVITVKSPSKTTTKDITDCYIRYVEPNPFGLTTYDIPFLQDTYAVKIVPSVVFKVIYRILTGKRLSTNGDGSFDVFEDSVVNFVLKTKFVFPYLLAKWKIDENLSALLPRDFTMIKSRESQE